MDVNDNKIPFKLPIRHEPLWKLAKEGKTKYIKTEEQSRRVAWRQVFRWLESQLALVKINMVNIEEIFLPYMMLSDNKTVYDKFLSTGFQNLLTDGK